MQKKIMAALVLGLFVMAGTGAALLNVFVSVDGSATVQQAVTLNAIESTYKYDATGGLIEFEHPGVTHYSLPHLQMIGGDEQDVWVLLSNYAEIPADVYLNKVVTRDGYTNTCDDDEVTMYKPVTTTISLCEKDPENNWECIPEGPSGSVEYNIYGPVLQAEVSLEGLEPNSYYQIALQGRMDGDGNEEIGNNCDVPGGAAAGFTEAWECGMWGDEGFWNFDMTAQTDEDGNFYGIYELVLPHVDPDGTHYGSNGAQPIGIGFLVKEAGEDPYTYEGPWTPVLMEIECMDYTISQVCDGEYIEVYCENGVTQTAEPEILQERPFLFDPTIPSETWYCIRNYFHLAATPGEYAFTINVLPNLE